MHNFGNRLKESLAKKGTTQVALSEYMDISPQAVQKWAAGNTPTLDNIVKIADFLGVSPAWLLFGETGSSDDLLVAVPEYDIDFSCGNGKSLFEDREPVRYVYYLRAWFVENSINPRRAVRVRIKGDSMKPFLWEGDSALLNLDEVHVVDGGVYAFGIDDDLFIKRLSIVPGTGLRGVSDNEAYAPQVLEYERFEGRLRVFGRVRDKSGRGGL